MNFFQPLASRRGPSRSFSGEEENVEYITSSEEEKGRMVRELNARVNYER